MEELIPFAQNSLLLEPIRVNAEVILLKDNILNFRFELLDPEKLVLDSLLPGLLKGNEIARADNLWKTTCLEAFWGIPGEKGYWEINIAPEGKRWNCYRFADYRTPQPPTLCYDHEIIAVQVTENSLECSVKGKVDLTCIEASLCSIVRTFKGMHFFSKVHSAPKPDFHLRQSFVLQRRS